MMVIMSLFRNSRLTQGANMLILLVGFTNVTVSLYSDECLG